MQIIETNLKFSELKPRLKTKKIVIHHTATDKDVSAETVHSWHLNKGWSGIGYHYLIRQDGMIERGRPETTMGAHAGPEGNADGIGIALAGNFEIEKPTEKQMESVVYLIKDIIKRYGDLEIIGHRDVMTTACPGKLFPIEEVRKRVKEDNANKTEAWKLDIVNQAKNKGIITADHDPDEPATKWFVLAVALNLLKLVGKK